MQECDNARCNIDRLKEYNIARIQEYKNGKNRKTGKSDTNGKNS